MNNPESLVPVSSLYPGDLVLSDEKVGFYVAELERIGRIKPIVIAALSERRVVRDGNHRMRAFIEFHRRQGGEIPDVPAVTKSLDANTPVDRYLARRWADFIDYYGCGAEAFLHMNIGPFATFDERRAAADAAIRDWKMRGKPNDDPIRNKSADNDR
jgi:hypothetical protein